MKRLRYYLFVLISILMFAVTSQTVTAQAQPVGEATVETVKTRVGTIDLELGVPTEASVKKLFDAIDFQRACQAYIWALPTVGFEYLRREHWEELGARNGDVVIYKGHRDVSRFLTPNVTTPYIIGFMDLEESGPTVLEVPAGAIAGSAMDYWQRPLTDFGVTGPDRGKGGKYILIGPGQDVPKNLPGEIQIVNSSTFGIGFFYRALDADPVKAEALEKGINSYPWTQRDNPRPTQHLKPPAVMTTTVPRGMEYWKQLNDIIQHEPVQDRDRLFMAMLRPLGIERGKPFSPDDRQKQILLEGARVVS